MRTRKPVFLANFVIFLCVLGTKPAWGRRFDCASSNCGFGSQVANPVTSTMSTSRWSGTVTSTVYANGGLFTYVYTFMLHTGSVQLSQLTAGTGGLDLFNSSLNWGVVTDQTSRAVSVPDFTFGTTGFLVKPVGLGPVGSSGSPLQLTFYVQSSEGATTATFSATDGVMSASGASVDPAARESASVALLGTAMFGAAAFLHRKLVASRAGDQVEA